ncbi:MAG: hypothetical protein D6714_05285 [Bacteroidetes bacterium]|nr:MAG: hypothetical protein D6714_05285 [Bacteroidota bacterium]
MKFFCALCFLTLTFTTAHAQLEKVLHQTFEIGDVAEIKLDLYGEYQIEPWVGENVMTETQIQLTGASPAILKHFVEKARRYDVEMEIQDGVARFYSFDKERPGIRTRESNCTEKVQMRIFVPDDFKIVDQKTLVRKPKPEEN